MKNRIINKITYIYLNNTHKIKNNQKNTMKTENINNIINNNN